MDRGERKARPVDARRPRHGQAPNTEDKERARRCGATRCFESVLKSWKVWPFSDDFGIQLLQRVRLWVRQKDGGGLLRGVTYAADSSRRPQLPQGAKKCHAPQEGAMHRFKPSMRGKCAAFAVRSISREVELPARSVFTRSNNRTDRDSSRTQDACQARFAPGFGKCFSGCLVCRHP